MTYHLLNHIVSTNSRTLEDGTIRKGLRDILEESKENIRNNETVLNEYPGIVRFVERLQKRLLDNFSYDTQLFCEFAYSQFLQYANMSDGRLEIFQDVDFNEQELVKKAVDYNLKIIEFSDLPKDFKNGTRSVEGVIDYFEMRRGAGPYAQNGS